MHADAWAVYHLSYSEGQKGRQWMKNEEGAKVNNFREVGGKRKLFFYESDGEMKFWL